MRSSCSSDVLKLPSECANDGPRGGQVAAAAAAAISLKLPEFYTDNPDVWFVYCEAQFLLRGVTHDHTCSTQLKYNEYLDPASCLHE